MYVLIQFVDFGFRVFPNTINIYDFAIEYITLSATFQGYATVLYPYTIYCKTFVRTYATILLKIGIEHQNKKMVRFIVCILFEFDKHLQESHTSDFTLYKQIYYSCFLMGFLVHNSSV